MRCPLAPLALPKLRLSSGFLCRQQTRWSKQKIGLLDLLVELLDRQPIRVARRAFGIFTVNADRCFKPNTFGRQQWARAEQALACRLDDVALERVTCARLAVSRSRHTRSSR